MAYIVYFKCSTVENMALTTIITSSTMIKNQVQVLRKPSKWFVKSHIAYVFIHRLFFSLLLLSVVARLHHTNDVKTSFSIRLKLNVFQSHCWPTVRFTIKLWAPNTSFKVIPILSVLIFLTLFFGSYFRHLSINASFFLYFIPHTVFIWSNRCE